MDQIVKAAEYAGMRRSAVGCAPHYAAPSGLTCYACPIDDCGWHHDDRTDSPSAPEALETIVRKHLSGHDLADYLKAIVSAEVAARRVADANGRAWDVVKLMRLRAVNRGEDPYSDPVGQMLSASLIGHGSHEGVRREIEALENASPGSPPFPSA